MKLLKIGRSSSCDIVLPSENVSSLHAELLLLDSGEIFITDKNSTNGTIVANKRISPNTEVQIHRGDFIRLADVDLPWSRVPHVSTPSGFKQVINIGSNFRNDVILQGEFCSRFHAMLKISKNGKKAYICDNHSKNGVKVNGIKVAPGRDVEIKRGDNIVCADQDITEELKPYIPNPWGWLKPTGIIAAIAALLAGIVFLISGKGDVKALRNVNPSEMASAVVYVYTEFDYVVTINDNPIAELWDGKYEVTPEHGGISGTAFFIDEDGTLATNRHVAVPWEYISDSERSKILKEYTEEIQDELPYDRITSVEQYKMFRQTTLGAIIDRYTSSISEMNAVIARLRNSSLTISGNPKGYLVAYPNRNYSYYSQMDPCHLVAESKDPQKDVALLQLDTKKTPENVHKVFNLGTCITEDIQPQKDELITIGYPHGLYWANDQVKKEIQPHINNLTCSKNPNKFEFEFQGETIAGASGSPIFDKKSRLVGVVYGGWADGTTYGLACKAKWLKELYDTINQ